MMNMANMMKQFNTMQKKLTTAQEELKSTEVEATSGNGAVKVIFDGQSKFKSIKLSKEAINPDNPESVDNETVEMLEDLITQALMDCTKKSTQVLENKMKSITGGISIPGLF